VSIFTAKHWQAKKMVLDQDQTGPLVFQQDSHWRAPIIWGVDTLPCKG
jgi:hypothetical protein